MRNWKLIYMCEQYNRICKLYSQIGEESIYGKLIEPCICVHKNIYGGLCETKQR